MLDSPEKCKFSEKYANLQQFTKRSFAEDYTNQIMFYVRTFSDLT